MAKSTKRVFLTDIERRIVCGCLRVDIPRVSRLAEGGERFGLRFYPGLLKGYEGLYRRLRCGRK